MSSYDPRIVAQALEDLESELTHWSSIASDMLSMAEDTQRHAKESVDRALHNAAIVLDRAQDDQDNIAKAKGTVASNLEKCLSAVNTAKETLQACQTALAESNTTLKKWEIELEKALAWLARAEERLEKAIQELQRAQNALRSAEWNLSSAESRLRNCQNDKERSNCSGEAAAVSRARAEVASARLWVRAAEQEVIAAKEEVERAKARVACCKRAVAFATEAVNLAQESVSSATQSINSAERSMEFARAAERLELVAEKNMLAEVEAADNMMGETKSAQELTDNAAIHLRSADNAENSAQIYSTSVRKELEYRMQMLYELNMPNISNSSIASNAPSTSRIQSAPRTRNFTDKSGRFITLRSWESDKQTLIRAYDANKGPVPDTVSVGQAGYVNATLEKSPNGQSRVRLNDIVTSSEYRGSGIGGQMLGEVERFARQHNAGEIYGSIDSENARDFWAGQSANGWTIIPTEGSYYGEVHYSLKK